MITSIIYIILSILVATTVSINDIPAGITIGFILIITFLYSKIGPSREYGTRVKLFAIVSFCYILSSVITSTCFSDSTYFMASDPMRYIQMVNRSIDINDIYSELERCYVDLADNNGLYNSILRFLGIICYKYNLVATPLLVTLPQTLFGILVIQTLYLILLEIKLPRQAFKYTLYYAFFSLVLLYSGIIVRDIVIAFFYAVCIKVVIKPYSLKGLCILFLNLVLCAGIRLYSGLFIAIFALYYLFFNVKGRLSKIVLYPTAALVLSIILSSTFLGEIKSQTVDEIDGYVEWQNEASESDGFSGQLRKLPSGINNLALSLFSQMNPFPPYSILRNSNLSLPQIYMGSLMMVSSIWWYFISYGLLWLFIFHKGYSKLGIRKDVLYAIAWLLIIISCTMHVDIRRIIPIYPIIYFLYVYCRQIYSPSILKSVNIKLITIYISLNLLYVLIK